MPVILSIYLFFPLLPWHQCTEDKVKFRTGMWPGFNAAFSVRFQKRMLKHANNKLLWGKRRILQFIKLMWGDSEAMKGAAGGRQECCIACIPQGPRSTIILLSKLNLHSEGQVGRPKMLWAQWPIASAEGVDIVQKKAIASDPTLD